MLVHCGLNLSCTKITRILCSRNLAGGINMLCFSTEVIPKRRTPASVNLLSLTMGNQERCIVEEHYGAQLGDAGYYRVYGKYIDHAEETRVGGDTDALDRFTQGGTGFRTDWKGPQASQSDYTLEGNMHRSKPSDFRSPPMFVTPFSQLEPENIDAQGLGRWNLCSLPTDANVALINQSFLVV